ncbi:MAG: dephospho-CoA kinase [Trichlorobacter sp.]|jgi:dephospho-CoA kinase|nr:dephospho-CoA kinase [Trichlorobacter sp.]
MKTIGLTGGVATGKSTVAKILEQLGATVIDADQLSRDVVAPGSRLLTQIAQQFGSNLIQKDGSLDRQQMRNLVFNNNHKRKQLEALLHPAIKELALQKLEQARQSKVKAAVYMAPLLIEAGATDRVDEIWVVTTDPQVQLQRLINRDGCNLQQAEQIIAAQMPLAEKESYGQVIINNSRSLEETTRQVLEAWRQRIEQT